MIHAEVVDGQCVASVVKPQMSLNIIVPRTRGAPSAKPLLLPADPSAALSARCADLPAVYRAARSDR
jgi:hypothetical protein